MKTGINQWAFPPDLPAARAMSLAREAGFEAFEVTVTRDGPLPLDADPKSLDAIRRHADALDLQISGVATDLGWRFPLSAQDPAQRKEALRIVRQMLAIARELGAPHVVVVPGVVDAAAPYDRVLETALTSIEELLPEAESLRVTLAIENVWNHFLLSPLEMRGFIDQFESPQVGACFDIGNAMQHGFPEQWIRILGKRIRAIHATDFRRAAGTEAGFVMLLEGDVDWPAVMQALEQIGYAGALTAEYPPYRHAGETVLAHVHAGLRGLLTLR